MYVSFERPFPGVGQRQEKDKGVGHRESVPEPAPKQQVDLRNRKDTSFFGARNG
jgi:hypothetical protein